MINKRLLVKNLLAHNDESSFYDKKRKIDLSSKEGKAKFLKHICALSNSNPKNNSYIVIGVEDETNEIVGVDFFDDSKIQNLINAYLTNPPIINYENIAFPNLPNNKVVALVTIRPTEKITSLRKNIWKYWGGSIFLRDGSISMPKNFDIEIKDVNSKIVQAIENKAKNNIEHTLEGVLHFITESHKDLDAHYKVFKEQFVVCWAGIKHKGKNNSTYLSRVDIELINEQVKLFYSTLDKVQISFTNNNFKIIEFVKLGLSSNYKNYPLEEVLISFNENGSYTIETKLIFTPPQYNKRTLYHLYNATIALLSKLESGSTLSKRENFDVQQIPATLLLCSLNNFSEAIPILKNAKATLKKIGGTLYQSYKEALRIHRKIKYN